MEYTVQKLGQLAGISTRTLRYYDEIGILKPARISSSGYRIYGQSQVNQLQQILFYRELGISLEQIKDLVTAPNFEPTEALKEHYKQLLDKREQLDLLIANVQKTIAQSEGRITMTDEEKFEGFKQRMIDENEAKYGQEIRAQYGNEMVDQSNAKLGSMTKEQHEALDQLTNELMATLAEAYKTGNHAGELAQQAAELHKRWLSFYWPKYSKEAHAGLVQMYVEDERFKQYYDKQQPGTAQFLRDAVVHFTGMNQ